MREPAGAHSEYPGQFGNRTWRRWVLRALLATTLLLPALVLFRPAARLAWFPLGEDGYYSLSVARNVALGRGVTVDGQHLTNGFQPLFTLLCAGPYWLTGGDRLSTLRLIVALHYVLYAGAAWLFTIALRKLTPNTPDRPDALFGALFLASTPLYVHFFNGLETGLVLFLVLAFMVTAFGKTNWSTRHALAVGGVLGALILARIDTALLTVTMGIAILLTLTLSWRERMTYTAAVGTGAFVVSLPWWAYNQLWFHSPIPSSAQQQIGPAFSGGRVAAATAAAVQAATNTGYPAYFTEYHHSLVFSGLVVLGLVAVIVPIWMSRRRAMSSGTRQYGLAIRLKKGSPGARAVLAVILFAAVLIPTYGVGSTATHYYPRYLSVWSILGLAGLCYLTTQVTGRLQATVQVLCAVWIAGQIGLRLFNNQYQERNFYQDQVELIHERVPTGQRVGAFQSGTLGYFMDGIVNLDGKVNAQALQARRNGQIVRYISDQQIDWLCDWRDILKGQLGSEFVNWEEVASREGMILLRRRVSGAS